MKDRKNCPVQLLVVKKIKQKIATILIRKGGNVILLLVVNEYSCAINKEMGSEADKE